MTISRESTKKITPATPADSAGRLDRKRSKTREKIFRAATELFATKGFTNTTIEDITEAADVGKGTFFNYFPTKEHVLGVLHELQVGKVRAAREEAKSSGRPVREVLRSLMGLMTQEPGRSQTLARSLLIIVFSSEPVRAMMMAGLAEGRKLLEEIITTGQRRGEVRKDLSPEVMARHFQQSVMGMVLIWSCGPPVSLPERVEQAFEMYWSAVRAL